MLKRLSSILLAAIACVTIATPVFAANGMPSNEEAYLKKRMEIQKTENEKIKEYIKLQDAKSKAEKRPISDIESLKRQALQGIEQGNNNLLQMGENAIACGNPGGEYNIATMDQQAYEGFVSGMAELERIKQTTWMQYTFRTH